MQSLFQKLKKVAIGFFVSLIVVSFAYAPASPAQAPKQTEAFLGFGDTVLEVGPALIKTTVSAIANVASQINTWSLNWKETVGDGIAYALINGIIENLIQSVTQWVASGFDGKPAFVENLNKFVGNFADEAVGDFIWESDALNFVCSPFQLNIKMALDIQYAGLDGVGGVDGKRDYHKAKCTLSDSIKNVESATAMAKNFDNWFEVSMRQTNNIYGAGVTAQAGLNTITTAGTKTEINMLGWAQGFFSKKDPETGKIITPGQTIQQGIANTLNIPNERLAFADEINELIGALLTQLARGVLSEVGGGLAGLGGGSGSDSIWNNSAYASSSLNLMPIPSNCLDTSDAAASAAVEATKNNNAGSTSTALSTIPGCGSTSSGTGNGASTGSGGAGIPPGGSLTPGT